LIMSLNVLRKLRVIGIEDGSFERGISKSTLLALVLFDGLKIVDLKFVEVKVDGLDATPKVVKALTKWTFDAVMLAGVSFAGFNIIDPFRLFEKFCKPVVVVSRVKPNNTAVKRALKKHFKDWKIRWRTFEKLGSIIKVNVMINEPPLYIESIGQSVKWAEGLVKAFSVFRIPEPLRVARLIARGVS